MAQVNAHSRRRSKPILSCLLCRERKLRCDRRSPCSACIRRGKSAECVFSLSEQERNEAIDYRPYARQDARQRVARLESLVMEMRNREQATGNAVDLPAINELSSLDSQSSDSQTLDGMGKLSLADDQTVYTGSSHWATILDDIQGLKEDLSDGEAEDLESQGSGLGDSALGKIPPVPRISLFKSATSLNKHQIIEMMPPRKVVDRHLSHFFRDFDMASFVVHRHTFLEEYAKFWLKPLETPIMWIGLLFGVMSMSAFLHCQDAEALESSAKDSKDELDAYRNLLTHCLNTGNYLHPSKYTLEALVLHFGVENHVGYDIFFGNWILLGVIIRIALRMGYHRDPSHWPHIPPIQAELRRRLWLSLFHMDFFTSTQVGLPRIIKDSQYDTRPPAHLFDDDLRPEQTEVPPERPLTDPTPLLFNIQRNHIIRVAAEIYDATEAALPPTRAIVTALGAKLDRAIEMIPKWLRYRSLETSVADDPMTILNRIFLDTLIQKAIYLLHRRSFVSAVPGEDNSQSIQLCIDAALAILAHQRRINEEIQPGGFLFSTRWKGVSSLNHEFLQATMLLCFALSKFNKHDGDGSRDSLLPRHDEIIDALNQAKQIWESITGRSNEAQRAAKVISTVLRRGSTTSSTPNFKIEDGPLQGFSSAAAPNFLNDFDYGQSMALDPSLWSGTDMEMDFGNVLEQFGTENSAESWMQQHGDPTSFNVESFNPS